MGKRKLILEDGTIFTGEAFGGEADVKGEVIFHTGMTGYQEIVSDPSYFGKIVTLTYPSIGAAGINRDDFESIKPYVNGIIAREICQEPSNFRNEETIDQFLKKHNIPGIAGIDTRMLTRQLRQKGTVKGIITDVELDSDEYKQLQIDEESTFVEETSITRPYIVPGRGKRIVMIDFGMKHSILHELTSRNCHVTVVPYNYQTEDILRFKPDGILLSHGPGNPNLLTSTIETIKSLLGLPMLGIGFGHQLLALACGATINKRAVGQYGTNFPVKDVQSDQTWLTTQSSNYKVEESSLKHTSLNVTFRSINDDTIQGVIHSIYPAISVQFNPEGAPGTNETNFIFDQFLELMEERQLENGGLPHA